VTQFGRALADLNIEIICANSPQAKGRVERMNQTLQDRLVKELRLCDIATMDAGNAFLPEFMADYNRRFGRAPQNPHDAHRPLRDDEDLGLIFTWQEERTLSQNLTFHFKRMTYLVKPGPETLPLARKDVRIHEWEDGCVEIHCQGRQLPYSIFDQNPSVNQGAVVENKRLGEVLSTIQVAQAKRDRARLASKGLTKREKGRISAARAAAGVAPTPPPEPVTEDRLGAVFSFLEGFEAQQKARHRAYNDKAALSRRKASGQSQPKRGSQRTRVRT
jgi:hypothetical protein